MLFRSYLAGRVQGIDIHRAGSGNSGATNALRVLGKGPAAIVLAVDAAKGVLAVLGVPPLVLWLVILWSNLIPGPASLFLEPLSLPLVAGGGTLSPWQISRLVFYSFDAISLMELVRITAGAACVAGHVFPLWLGFRGGKGVATGAAVASALAPKAALVCLAGFILVVAISRYVSLASISAALILPFAYTVLYRSETFSWPILGQLPL